MTRKNMLIIMLIIASMIIGVVLQMRNYSLSQAGYEELCDYEGFSPTPYLDSVGVKTVGFGATASDIPDLHLWSWDKEISLEDALKMLKKHQQKYADAVNKKLTVDIEQHQFDALVTITYNIGTGGMEGSTFIKRVNAGMSPKSVAEAMMMWNKGTIRGKRAVINGLTNRRKAEGELYMTGNYNNDLRCTLINVDPTTHKPKYTGSIDLSQYLQ